MALNLKTETVFTDDRPAVQAQPPLPPEQIAPHFPQLEVLECLGRGGMGVVYRARQKSLNRLVALKLLAPERVDDPQFADRFSREAHALAALNHPNIVTVYDFGQAGGFYFLLMEFVDGVNLRQLLRARKFTPEEALTIVPPLCDALQFAHERGIVHRDIKPENLLLDKAGRVKVADFGIAKMLGPVNGDSTGRSASHESATQSTIGTPGYSAPEQKTSPQRVDSRADIYSLGVVFYEMLTGELPGKPVEPPSKKVQIDVRLDEVVLRALEKKPELRYQQASQIKTDVETISGSAAPRPSSTPPERVTARAEARLGLPTIAFALCYAGFIRYLAHSAQLLPARVASHFGWNLAADDWMPRQTFLFIIGVVPLIFPLIFLGIFSTLSRRPASARSAPHVLGQGLWFACLFTGFLFGVQYLTVQANGIVPPRLPTGQFLFLIIGFLAASVLFAIQAIHRIATLDSPGHSTDAISSNTQRRAFKVVIVPLCLILVGLVVWFFLKERLTQDPNSTRFNQFSTLTPAAGPVELKIKWPPVGERLVLDTETKRNGEYLNPGQPSPLKEDLTVGKKYGLTVLKTTPGGGHEVELEFLSLRERAVLGGKKVVDYDSTWNLSALGTNSMADLWGKVVGSKIRYFLDASNEIERVEGIDELEHRLSSGEATNTSVFSRIPYGRDYLKEMMSGLHLFLPPKPVQPGDTWPVQKELAMGPLGTVSMDFTVTFKNWEPHWNRNCARLEFQSTVKTKPDPNSNPAGSSASSLEGTSSGAAWFDPALGMIIETAANSDMKMVINRPGNPGGNPGGSGPTPGTVYQWHDAVNTTVVLDAPDAATAGIGVALRVDGENIIVQEIIPGLPAAAQKDIHAGDRIIAVAQDTGPAVPVHGGQLAQAVALMRGSAGTTVRLTLVSSGEDDTHARVVSFVRAELKAPPR